MAISFEARCEALVARLTDIQTRFKDIVHEMIEVGAEAEHFVSIEAKDDPELQAALAPMLVQMRTYMVTLREVVQR